eukprot:SAG31_NODE_1061_length_10108_cov_5.521930_10_plen_96_part_00
MTAFDLHSIFKISLFVLFCSFFVHHTAAHTRTLPSTLAETMHAPSGLKLAERTECSWPINVISHAPAAKAAVKPWPLSVISHAPVAEAAHTRTVG